MKIGNVVDTIVSLYNNENTRKRAVFLLGPSGIGKSQAVYQAAAQLGVPVIDLRLAQCDPTDLRGVPTVKGGKTVWNPPSFFPDANKPAGIFFLDELSSAPPAVQAVAYQLVLDRAIGDYVLPDGWMVLAAGNRQSDRGVTFTIASPLLNRMTVLEVDTVLDDWREYAAGQGVRPEVLAFLSDRADMLHKFDKDYYGKQFPSPRGWFAVSDILNLDLPPATRLELIKGAVGHEAALLFEQFLRIWETMPSIDTILSNPDSVPVPEQLNVRYCLAMGLSARLNKANFATAWRFIKRLPTELQVLTVLLAVRRDKTIDQSPAFSDWALQNRAAFTR